MYLFIYFTANAFVFPREFGGYFGSVFELWHLSRNQPCPFIFIKKNSSFVCFYGHKSVVIYALISRIICGILGFHGMKKCSMNEKCKAKPTEGINTSQDKKQYYEYM